MPKRATSSSDGTHSASKRSRRDDASKRKKSRSGVVLPAEPLNITVSRWRWPEAPEAEGTSSTDISSAPSAPQITKTNYRVVESVPLNWKQVLINYRDNKSSITDILFTTNDGHKVRAHSLILRIRVPYFHNLLPGKHPSPDGKPAEVVVEWSDSDTLQCIIDYAYFFRTAKDFALPQVFKVYTAAMHIEWEELETSCYEQFQEQLAQNNCLAWLEWAIANNVQLVKLRAASFAAAHMEVLQEERQQDLTDLSLEAHLSINNYNYLS